MSDESEAPVQNPIKAPVKTRAVMQGNCQIIDGLMTVREAIHIMKSTGAEALIVDKRDEHDEYGIVLLSDIAKKVLGPDRSPDRVNVFEIMTKPVISVSPDMDIRYCVRLFEKFGLAVAPVIDHHQVLGLVRYKDLVLEGMT